MTQTVYTRRQTEVFTIVDDETLTVPAAGTLVIESDDIIIAPYSTAVLMATAGAETATTTLDVTLEIKDSNGNYYTHSAMTQISQAGSSVKLLDPLYGHTGRVVVTVGDAENDEFEDVTVELVLKS